MSLTKVCLLAWLKATPKLRRPIRLLLHIRGGTANKQSKKSLSILVR